MINFVLGWVSDDCRVVRVSDDRRISSNLCLMYLSGSVMLSGLLRLSLLIHLGHLSELLCLVLVHSSVLGCLGCLLRGLGCMLGCPSCLGILLVLVLIHPGVLVGSHSGA